MKENSTTLFCTNCPRNHYGVCSGIYQILNQAYDIHSLNHFPLAAKQYLYHQGEVTHQTYILRDGWILLTKVSEQGNRQVIRSILPGDILGFHPDQDKPSNFSAVAIQDSIICNIPGFMEICYAHPELALKLVHAETSETTLSELNMVNIAHNDAHKKVAFMLFELYERLKFRGLNNGNSIPFPLKQTDIADTLGLSAIHVNRTLHKLQQEKMISIVKHKLTILDY